MSKDDTRGQNSDLAKAGQKPQREKYEAPLVQVVSISPTEALMAICKMPGPPCQPMRGGGS